MKKHWMMVVLCCTALLALQCSQANHDANTADEAAVKQITPAWFKAYNAGDVAGIAALYADDAVLLPPGVPAAHGKQEILEALAKDIAGGLTNSAGPVTDFGMSGDLAWDSGTYTAKDKAGNIVDNGKYLTVYAKKDGKWSIIRDTWNSDGPMDMPKAN